MTTIHIFSYGEAQIISKDLNYKAPVAEFTKLKAVIDDVKSKKPSDKKASDYHAINIFDNKATYLTREDDQSFQAGVDATKLSALVSEFKNLSKKS